MLNMLVHHDWQSFYILTGTTSATLKGLLDVQLAPLGLAIAALLCLTIGLHNTWVLTVWLATHRNQQPQTEGNVR